MATRACKKQHEETLKIVLIGTSGCGKSATGNTIIGERKFKSQVSDQSVTEECEEYEAIMKIANINVKVIDTPGCHCTKMPHVQVIEKLKELNYTLKGPHAFLLVISVGDFTPKEIQTVSMLHDALGNYLPHTVIVFSRSDDLQLKSRKEFLRGGNKEFQKLVKKCNRYHFINNRMVNRNEDEITEIILDLVKVAKNNEKLMKKVHKGKMTQQKTEVKAPVTGDRAEESYGSQWANRKGQRSLKRESVNEMTLSNAVNTHLFANTCLMVLGIKGVGKSATIKSLLPGAEHAVHEECSVYSKGQLKIVECPGFDENPGEIREAIERGVRVCTPGPQVILVVMTVGRFSPATKQTMQHVQAILGEAAQKHVIIVFTRKDDLEGASLEQFLSESRDLETFVTTFGSSSFALENRSADVQSQVMELKGMIGGMLQSNNHIIYTLPGLKMQAAHPGPTSSLSRMGEVGHSGVESNVPSSWGGETVTLVNSSSNL